MELEGYHLLEESTACWPTVRGGNTVDETTRSIVFTTQGITDKVAEIPECEGYISSYCRILIQETRVLDERMTLIVIDDSVQNIQFACEVPSNGTSDTELRRFIDEDLAERLSNAFWWTNKDVSLHEKDNYREVEVSGWTARVYPDVTTRDNPEVTPVPTPRKELP